MAMKKVFQLLILTFAFNTTAFCQNDTIASQERKAQEARDAMEEYFLRKARMQAIKDSINVIMQEITDSLNARTDSILSPKKQKTANPQKTKIKVVKAP